MGKSLVFCFLAQGVFQLVMIKTYEWGTLYSSSQTWATRNELRVMELASDAPYGRRLRNTWPTREHGMMSSRPPHCQTWLTHTQTTSAQSLNKHDKLLAKRQDNLQIY